MSTNDITGDRVASKIPSKAFEQNYDRIEKTWRKHDGSNTLPVPPHQMVKIETYTPKCQSTYIARDVNWSCVKWYALA